MCVVKGQNLVVGQSSEYAATFKYDAYMLMLTLSSARRMTSAPTYVAIAACRQNPVGHFGWRSSPKLSTQKKLSYCGSYEQVMA